MEFLKLSRLILVLLLFFVTACGLLNPFIDRRREAGVTDLSKLYVGASTPEKPAVCYNILTASVADVQKLADQECVRQGTGTHAVPTKQTLFTCRLLLPNHVFFECVK